MARQSPLNGLTSIFRNGNRKIFLEKKTPKNRIIHLTFVDLKKTYDFIP